MLGTCATAQVISAHQVRVDGEIPSTRDAFLGGSLLRWFGTALRLDGARDALLLDGALGQADLRARVPGTVAKLSRSRGERLPPITLGESEPDPDALILTDGLSTWSAHVILTPAQEMLLLFSEGMPPSNTVLHISQGVRAPAPTPVRNTICFTQGTQILTEDGPRPIETLHPGDRVLTRDDGPQEILWMGMRHISGARLYAMPYLRPVRIRAGALGQGEPQPDLILSPDHQVMLSTPRARALWGEEEVLVRARDLLDDRRVILDHRTTEVVYIHLLFARHQVIWANRVEVESFHPGDAEL
ncbi:MAG: Hint domain-containing protein, partial [Pseudomonadota bacterium]